MRIAVTGGMGFIGHELVSELLAQRHEVVLVDFWKDLVRRYEKAKLPIIQEIYGILPRCFDVVEPWDFVNDFSKYDLDLVVHAGAVVDTTDLGSDDLMDRNVQYTKEIAHRCSQNGTHLIFISSAAVYGVHGRPNNPYGLTKALGERIVSQIAGEQQVVSLRLFNVFGKNEHHKGTMASVPWKIAQAFQRGGHFEMFNIDAKRDFVPSSTVVRVISELAPNMYGDQRKSYSVYDVGTGIPMSFKQLGDEIASAYNFKGDPFVPNGKIRIVNPPAHLEGRYQFYTCAGKNGVENLGGSMGTAQGIREAYGVDNR